MAWEDQRSGTTVIYAQKINSDGSTAWDANGVLVCQFNSEKHSPRLARDGTGGIFVVWEDLRNDTGAGTNIDLYFQRINSLGQRVLTNSAVLSNESDNQTAPNIVYTGDNKAIVVWEHEIKITSPTPGVEHDLYAQKIDLNCNLEWGSNVVIVSETNSQFSPSLVSYNQGAVIVWEDSRNGAKRRDIYAQRVDSSGNLQWESKGKVVSSHTVDQWLPKLVNSDNGSVIITWFEQESSKAVNYDVYAQKLSVNGDIIWNKDIAVCTATGNQNWNRIISDDSNGAIITWFDTRIRGGETGSLYAQRITGNGSVSWTNNGILIKDNVLFDETSNIFGYWTTTDDNNGAIVCWTDLRDSNVDVYAQRINSNGDLVWYEDGIIVVGSSGNQTSPQLVKDGNGGAFIVWEDYRSGDSDIFLQKIDLSGALKSP